jgi:hypothetical protein
MKYFCQMFFPGFLSRGYGEKPKIQRTSFDKGLTSEGIRAKKNHD